MKWPSDLAPAWMKRQRLFADVLLALDIGVPIHLPAHMRDGEAILGDPTERLLALVAAFGGTIVWYDATETSA